MPDGGGGFLVLGDTHLRRRRFVQGRDHGRRPGREPGERGVDVRVVAPPTPARRRDAGGTAAPSRAGDGYRRAAARTRSSSSAARPPHPLRSPSVPSAARGFAAGPTVPAGRGPGQPVARRPRARRRRRPGGRLRFGLVGPRPRGRRGRPRPGAERRERHREGAGPRGPPGGDRAGDGGRFAAARRPARCPGEGGRGADRPEAIPARDRVETPYRRRPTSRRPPDYLWGQLDDLDKQVTSGEAGRQIARVLGTGVVAYVGYVLLNGRGGYVLLSLLTAKPLWSQVDPLAVLLDWERDKKRKTPVPGRRGDLAVPDRREPRPGTRRGR